MNEQHPESRARMVDVTEKSVAKREAVAECVVRMSASTIELLHKGALPKGDALEIARIAGIMAAKKTSEIIPLCHPIALGAIDVSFEEHPSGIGIRATVQATERTGVEMEALTAVAVAGLTIYDMVKGTERQVELADIRLLSKSGGRSGTWKRDE